MTLRAKGVERIEPTRHRRGGLGPARQRLRRHHALPDGELVVHGRQRARQAARVPALHRRRRRLPRRLRRGRRAATSSASSSTGPGGTQVNDGVDPPAAARRADGADDDGRAGAAAARVDDAGRGPRLHGAGRPTVRPPGPEVGEIVDGVLPGAAGNDLEYRLYRPAGDGPHPVVCYFHGGGWVLGDSQSDDPFCRDLCVRSDAVIVSVELPPRPGGPLPGRRRRRLRRAAVGRRPRHRARRHPRASSSWPAGAPAANVAAVAAQRARDEGGPDLAGQFLLTPVTDSDFTRPSYVENADGYVLTKALMDWFWDHYCDPADRTDPRVAPLRAADLSRPAAGLHRHVRVRPAARRGQRLRRGAGRRRRAGHARPGPRATPTRR